MNKKLTFWGATGFVVLYFVAVFISEFFGFIHPVCWVLAPALGALLGAFPYCWLSLRWHKFGLGTVLAAVFGLLMMAMGEVDFTRLLIIVGFGLLSDLVRMGVHAQISSARAIGSCTITYPILALGNIAMIVYMWTRKAWYLQGAAEEMGQPYADAMAPLQNTLWLVIAVVAIVIAAEVGLWISKKLIK